MKKISTALFCCSFTMSTIAATPGLLIEVNAGSDKASSSVKASGEIFSEATIRDLAAFRIKDFKHCIGVQTGTHPEYAVFRKEDDKKDLFYKYNWQPLTRKLTVKDAKIISVTSKPEVISSVVQKNMSKDTPAKFKFAGHVDKSNSATSTWTSSNSLEIKKDVDVSVKVAGAGISSKTELAYTHSWGKGGSQKQLVSVGTDLGVEVVLQPQQYGRSDISLSAGTMKVEVTYEATLEGAIAIAFTDSQVIKGIDGRHFYFKIGLGRLYGGCGVSLEQRTLEFKETIEVGFYSNGSVTLNTSYKEFD